jgi:integrase
MTSKTGASVRPLGLEAIEVLQQIKHISLPDVFVFPSVRSSGGTFGGFPRAWKRITTNSELSKEELQALSEISAHSLRHGFATIANDIGLTLPTVSSLLGHSLGGVTAGYVSQIDATLTAAADKTCRAISIKLGSSNHDNVIKYRALGQF